MTLVPRTPLVTLVTPVGPSPDLLDPKNRSATQFYPGEQRLLREELFYRQKPQV